MKPCPRCRYPNKEGSPFCNLCGETLASSPATGDPAAPTERDVPPVESARSAAPRPSFGFPVMPSAGSAPLPAATPVAQLGYYLVCHPYPPLKLAPGTEFLIGREKTNPLVLPASLVSRRHASVRWNGEGYLLKDLGSANGTYLNGKRIREQVLAPGDRINIGTFAILFQALTPAEARNSLFAEGDVSEGTVALDMQAVQAELGGWSGSLAEIGLAQILQVLESDRKTGILSVRIASVNGEMCFQEGRLVHAAYGESTAEEAVYAMFARPGGGFRFMPAMPGSAVTITAPLQAILLEATRRADESGRR